MNLQEAKEEIEATLGIRLAPEECGEEKLRKLRRLAGQPPGKTLVTLSIPLIPALDNLIDPRHNNSIYRKSFYTRKTTGRGCLSVNIPDLELVLDLDHTLVECILPPYPYQKATVEEYKSQITREFPQAQIQLLHYTQENQHLYMLYTVRPGANSFLLKLKKFANLRLFTRGQEGYVRELLTQLQWIEHFSQVICESKDRKSVQTRIGSVVRDRLLIVDDQLRVWVEEDQPYVVPVSRYMPLFKYDSNFKENLSNAQKFLTFSFAPELPDLREISETEARKSFLDSFDTKQMETLQRRLKLVHEYMFVRRKSAIASFKEVLRKELRDRQYEVMCPPGAEDRARVVTWVIEALGGKVKQGAQDKLVIPQVDSWGTPSPFSEIFKAYFKTANS